MTEIRAGIYRGISNAEYHAGQGLGASRVGKYRLTVFLQQVCTSPSPNRAYPSQGTRLSIYVNYE